MLNRRWLFQFAGVATVAGAAGAAWIFFGSPRSQALIAGPFRHYPFDPVAAENFRQKLFIPVASGTDVFLRSLAFDPMANEGAPGGMGGMRMGQMMAGMSSSRLPLGAEFNVLKLAVTAGDRVAATLPATLSQVRPIRRWIGTTMRRASVTAQTSLRGFPCRRSSVRRSSAGT